MTFYFKDWKFRVEFSEKLTIFIKEVQHLKSIGFEKDLLQKFLTIFSDSLKYYKKGVALKQLGNFYTSIGKWISEPHK